MNARIGTFLVVRRGGRNGDVKPLRQGVGVPDGELLSRLDISQRPVENLGGGEKKTSSGGLRGEAGGGERCQAAPEPRVGYLSSWQIRNSLQCLLLGVSGSPD